MYGFVQLNGTITSRDLCGFLPDELHGVVIDVTRHEISKFDYGVLEDLKNGYMLSGKYTGSARTFDPVPVTVFANHEPNYCQLSVDRWDVVQLGKLYLYNYVEYYIVNVYSTFIL